MKINEITQKLTPINNVKLAIYALKIVLPIFEDKYPNDDRPRKAIEASEAYVAKPCNETATDAYTAATDAHETSYAHETSVAAVYVAHAVVAANVAVDSAGVAVAAYVDSAYIASAMNITPLSKQSIFDYGLELIKNQ